MSKIKKKKRFSGALQFMSRVLYEMKDLIKLHNPDKFLEDSNFVSNFRDLQILA